MDSSTQGALTDTAALARSRNRKLLVSVFGPQEAREAVLGGARIIDSEDPRSALGNIKPTRIMDVSDTVLAAKRDLECQLSTNIGEDQWLYHRAEDDHAIAKSTYEIAGKSSQAALGVANAMGTRVHPSNIVKVGVDGMPVDMVRTVLQEVSTTLKRTEQFSHCQMMGVLFAQDIDLWNDRKTNEGVRRNLIELREFFPVATGTDFGFDLLEPGGASGLPGWKWLVGTVRDETGKLLFDPNDSALRDRPIDLYQLKELNVLPDYATSSWIALNELVPHKKFYPEAYGDAALPPKTNRNVVKLMIDACADSGATAMMLDTQIQTKVANISLVDTDSPAAEGLPGMVDLNSFDIPPIGLPTRGILKLPDLKYFVDYAHYRGIEANCAGSLQSFQAQQLWLLLRDLDQVSTRGGSSAIDVEPGTDVHAEDTRQQRVMKRQLVRGLVPPEQGGFLNIPDAMRSDPAARSAIDRLIEMLATECERQRLPRMRAFWVDRYGVQEEIV